MTMQAHQRADMDGQFTSGPWNSEPGFGPSTNGTRIVGADGTHIATITRKADKPISQKQADIRLIAAGPKLYKVLKQCLGVLCESGNLNNYRNLSDAELGKVWLETAKRAAAVLNEVDGIPGAAP